MESPSINPVSTWRSLSSFFNERAVVIMEELEKNLMHRAKNDPTRRFFLPAWLNRFAIAFARLEIVERRELAKHDTNSEEWENLEFGFGRLERTLKDLADIAGTAENMRVVDSACSGADNIANIMITFWPSPDGEELEYSSPVQIGRTEN